MNKARHQRNPQRPTRMAHHGVVAVEFAIVLPFILVIFLGSIELANLNFVRNMGNDTAFRVARALIVPGSSSRDAISKATERLEDIGVKGSSLDVRETDESVIVTIDIPIAKNSWGVGTLAANRSIQETCILKKAFNSNR